MLTIFNRRELFITFSLQKQAEIRNLLQANGIRCLVRTVSMSGASIKATGTYGINMDFAVEYIIYVHKKDLEQARSVIG